MAGQITSAGPLTTLFTPSSWCLNTIGDSSAFRYPGQESSVACFPSSMNLFGFDKSARAYFSPGRCPVSYTPYTNTILGHVLTTTIYTATEVSIAAPTDYVYNCCPSPMSPDSISTDQGCISYFTSLTVITWSQWDPMIRTIGPAQTTTLTNRFPISFYGYEVQVRFQNTDLSALGFQSSDLKAYGISVGAFSNSPVSVQTTQSIATSSNSPLPISLSSAIPTQMSLATTVMTGSSIQQANPHITSTSPISSTSIASSTSGSSGGDGGVNQTTTIVLATVIPVLSLIAAVVFGVNQWIKKERGHQHLPNTTPRHQTQNPRNIPPQQPFAMSPYSRATIP